MYKIQMGPRNCVQIGGVHISTVFFKQVVPVLGQNGPVILSISL